MKLIFNQARFEQFSYKLTDLLKKYEDPLEMRKETQTLLFEVLKEINQHGLSIETIKIGS